MNIITKPFDWLTSKLPALQDVTDYAQVKMYEHCPTRVMNVLNFFKEPEDVPQGFKDLRIGRFEVGKFHATELGQQAGQQIKDFAISTLGSIAGGVYPGIAIGAAAGQSFSNSGLVRQSFSGLVGQAFVGVMTFIAVSEFQDAFSPDNRIDQCATMLLNSIILPSIGSMCGQIASLKMAGSPVPPQEYLTDFAFRSMKGYTVNLCAQALCNKIPRPIFWTLTVGAGVVVGERVANRIVPKSRQVEVISEGDDHIERIEAITVPRSEKEYQVWRVGITAATIAAIGFGIPTIAGQVGGFYGKESYNYCIRDRNRLPFYHPQKPLAYLIAVAFPDGNFAEEMADSLFDKKSFLSLGLNALTKGGLQHYAENTSLAANIFTNCFNQYMRVIRENPHIAKAIELYRDACTNNWEDRGDFRVGVQRAIRKELRKHSFWAEACTTGVLANHIEGEIQRAVKQWIRQLPALEKTKFGFALTNQQDICTTKMLEMHLTFFLTHMVRKCYSPDARINLTGEDQRAFWGNVAYFSLNMAYPSLLPPQVTQSVIRAIEGTVLPVLVNNRPQRVPPSEPPSFLRHLFQSAIRRLFSGVRENILSFFRLFTCCFVPAPG